MKKIKPIFVDILREDIFDLTLLENSITRDLSLYGVRFKNTLEYNLCNLYIRVLQFKICLFKKLLKV